MTDKLNDLSKAIHENAVAHGWWETQVELPEILIMCISELVEALNDYRDGWNATQVEFECNAPPDAFGGSEFDMGCPGDCEICAYCGKPRGVAVELADCIIRILDYCGAAGIDIDKVITIKHEYNLTRPYRHGGKLI